MWTSTLFFGLFSCSLFFRLFRWLTTNQEREGSRAFAHQALLYDRRCTFSHKVIANSDFGEFSADMRQEFPIARAVVATLLAYWRAFSTQNIQ
jgi:hypothetical protein